MSQEKIDEFLQLPIVSFRSIFVGVVANFPLQTQNRIQPSFKNKYEFFKKIDQLPVGPDFTPKTVTITGDLLDQHGARMKEEVELWVRDPIECIRELLGNPMFREHTVYQPRRVYTSEARTSRVYDEMDTGDWWWDTQVRLSSTHSVRTDSNSGL